MTRAQALITMQALQPLMTAAGLRDVIGVDGQDGDLGQLMIRTPVGVIAVLVPLPNAFPVANLIPVLAAAQSSIRSSLRPFEGDCGRGFNGRRGKLAVAPPGFSANEGWV